ncbi:histidine ammonia-lyase [Nannocystis radixulma]|uniref:Histidine ammonia-lyase n=1 Tax=Nannocystis radixulma TaxID=2995305 RepID=A0ABT5B280_9BACT|nr:histidine ammonia-lyase [Nannocystis radixulma]MDC0667634.1 histidine ammonia-lyase [Nannocystis radixulma]
MTSGSPVSVVIGHTIALRDVDAVARRGAAVSLAREARDELRRTRDHLERALAGGAIIYGVNTGFGALSDAKIAPDELGILQQNLLRSHAAGVGPAFAGDVVRALLLLRAHTLALGASGVSPEVPEFLLQMLARDVLPVVPCQGSVGASGDLAPLAHLALVAIGEGTSWSEGQIVPGAEALARAGLTPLRLGPKEGLSLINGTQVTTAVGALALCDAAELLAAADIISSLSLDALLGTVTATDPRIHAGKPHVGQRESAAIARALLADSPLGASHRDCGEVQDAYALRCMPQVHGAARDAFAYVAGAVQVELNSFTDNPLVLAHEGGGFDVLSGGNFHAGTVALPLDHMTAALTTLATISERRTDRLMNPATSRGLPAFLAERPGVESGLMMAHVTASALASECKALSFPASVDTIPTSAGKEDHVSMGPIAARKLRSVVDNLARVLAIEAIAAARGLDLRQHRTSAPLQRVHAAIRAHVPAWTGDRSPGGDTEALAAAIVRGELRLAARVASPLDRG